MNRVISDYMQNNSDANGQGAVVTGSDNVAQDGKRR